MIAAPHPLAELAALWAAGSALASAAAPYFLAACAAIIVGCIVAEITK